MRVRVHFCVRALAFVIVGAFGCVLLTTHCELCFVCFLFLCFLCVRVDAGNASGGSCGGGELDLQSIYAR